MDPIPTQREELERKAVEYLEAKVHLAETGRMEKRDLRVISAALWNITSGLVDDSISALFSEACGEGQAPLMVRRFVGKGKVLITAWQAHGAGYVLQSIDAMTQEKKVIRTSKAHVGEREEELRTLFDTLSKSGYIEIN